MTIRAGDFELGRDDLGGSTALRACGCYMVVRSDGAHVFPCADPEHVEIMRDVVRRMADAGLPVAEGPR